MDAALKINDWLIADGRLAGDSVAVIDGYASHLVAAGVPLSRANIANRYANGTFATFYLAPHNYHRFHTPCALQVEAVDQFGARRRSNPAPDDGEDTEYALFTDNQNAPSGVIRGIVHSDLDFSRIAAASIQGIVGAFEDLVLAEFNGEYAMVLPPGIARIVGSKAGAFGMPQFLPSSYMRFAVDGNGNGRISLHEPADAAHSAANYLAAHGWKPGRTA